MTYRYVIDQLLHDSLFYQPVIEALNDDWNEQAKFVQQIFNIGSPTFKSVKSLQKEMKKTKNVMRKETKDRFMDKQNIMRIIKKHPSQLMEYIRRGVCLWQFPKCQNFY